MEKNYPYIDQNGNEKDRWVPYIAPLLGKVEGDALAARFIEIEEKLKKFK